MGQAIANGRAEDDLIGGCLLIAGAERADMDGLDKLRLAGKLYHLFRRGK
jgi:hypothetical protein